MAEDSSEKYSGDNVQAAGRSSPYPVARLSAPISLVDKAKLIESASATLSTVTNAKLETLAEQMRALQAQARAILDKAEQDLLLHEAECRFRPLVGRSYHLYRAAAGGLFFSMLAPEERASGSPEDYQGEYRLEADQSWTRMHHG